MDIRFDPGLSSRIYNDAHHGTSFFLQRRGSSVCLSHHLRRRDTQSELEISVQVYTRNSLEDQNELRTISGQSTEGAAVECPAAADRAREAD